MNEQFTDHDGRCAVHNYKPCDCKTSTSDRSDESLVRTIAEWMKIEIDLKNGWVSGKGLLVKHHNTWTTFAPHERWHSASADRERVILHILANQGSKALMLVISDTTVRLQLHKTPWPRAFIESATSWIEAQQSIR